MTEMTCRPKSGADAWTADMHPATMTAAAILAKVREAVTAARAINDHLDDPHGDGSGRDAQAPDGDAYDQLWDAISTLFHLVPRAESVR